MFIPNINHRELKFLKRIRTKIQRELLQVPFISSLSELAYQRAIHEYASYLPEIYPSDFCIVEALRSKGIFVTSLEKLGIPATSRLLHASQSLLPEILTTSTSGKKRYNVEQSFFQSP